MPSPDLSNDELERAAIAARAIASQHAEQATRLVEGPMREFFAEQARRYRALAMRFEESRAPSRGQ